MLYRVYAVTGKESGTLLSEWNMETISYLHAKKIRNEGDGAKLISANDSQNFTYRGRFIEKEEAFAVGSETSQKIHNALKWIIRRQGNFFDTLVLVTWEAGKQEEKEAEEMPEWDAGTDEIMSAFKMDIGALYVERSQDEKWDGKQLTAKMFGKALNGYRRKVKNTAHMILLGFDASTPGRLAMVEKKNWILQNICLIFKNGTRNAAGFMKQKRMERKNVFGEWSVSGILQIFCLV